MIKKNLTSNNRSLAISSVKIPKLALQKSEVNSALSSVKNRKDYECSVKNIGIKNNILSRRK